MSSLIRSTQAAGGFAAVLQKGSSEAGLLTLAYPTGRDAYQLWHEAFDMEGRSYWREGKGDMSGADLSQWIERERDFDPDFWVLEVEGISHDHLKDVSR